MGRNQFISSVLPQSCSVLPQRWNQLQMEHTRERKRDPKIQCVSCTASPSKWNLHIFHVVCAWRLTSLGSINLASLLISNKWMTAPTSDIHWGKLREMTSMIGPVWCLISCSFSSNIQKSNMVRCCYTTLGCGVFSCMIREAQISSLWLGTAQCGINFDSGVFLSAKCVRRAPALGVKSVTLSRICGLKHGL